MFGDFLLDEEKHLRCRQPKTKLLRRELLKQQGERQAENDRRTVQEIQEILGEYDSIFRRKFETMEILGYGSFGCVYKAQETLIHNMTWNFAVKRIPLPKSDSDMTAALREIDALVSFDHPGIVRFYESWIEQPPEGWQHGCSTAAPIKLEQNEVDHGDHHPRGPLSTHFQNFAVPTLTAMDDFVHTKLGCKEVISYDDNCAFLYIKMELCNKTLADWLENNKERELKRMKNWFKQIVSAVAYIHGKGRMHRDLKPRNIFFVDSDRLKVGDLGIVSDKEKPKTQDDDERTFGKFTKKYMAPEQTGWVKYDNKVDIFALGLILAELCVPMTDKQAEEVFNNYRDGLSNNILDAEPEVKKCVEWMTRKSSTDRPDCDMILNGTFLEDTLSPSQSEFIKNFEIEGLISGKTRNSFFNHPECCVFKARHLVDQNTYAVKKIPLQWQSRFSDDKFLRTIANIRHEGIVGYYNSWIEKPPETERWKHQTQHPDFDDNDWLNYPPDSVFLYVQMELFTMTLFDWLKDNSNKRDLNHAKKWLKQLLTAVAFLHKKSIVHGNLNPSTIYVDEDGHLKIDPTIRPTVEDSFLPSYEAPEQVYRDYRFGKTLRIPSDDPELIQFINLLTNKDPYERPTCEEVLNNAFLL